MKPVPFGYFEQVIENWNRACENYAHEIGLEPAWMERLRAFGPWQADRGTERFETVESRLLGQLDDLVGQITAALEEEVDAPQAAMFVRRFRAVVDRLGAMPTDDIARLLRVALVGRVHELAHGEGMLPRALRVRAAVDYFYSLCAVRHHALLREEAGREPLTAEQLVQSAQWQQVGEGVRWGRLNGDTENGPQHTNVLVIEPGAVSMQAADLRAEVDSGASFADSARTRNAVAAVSGGFFLYSEPDILAPSCRFDPVGLMVSEGEVISPPIFHRGTLLQLGDGSWHVGRQGLLGVRIRTSELSIVIGAVNTPEKVERVPVAFTRAWGKVVTEPSGPSMSVVGRRVVDIAPAGRSVPVPLNGCVITFPKGFPAILKRGDVVEWRLPRGAEGLSVEEAIAGGPVLIADGEDGLSFEREDFTGTAPPQTFSGDETGDHNLLPRMAAGIDATGRLIFAAVDGRNFERALGLSLYGTANLMRSLGCVAACNLDGGSSKRMVVRDRVVDLSTTEVVGPAKPVQQSVRPVHSGLFFVAR